MQQPSHTRLHLALGATLVAVLALAVSWFASPAAGPPLLSPLAGSDALRVEPASAELAAARAEQTSERGELGRALTDRRLLFEVVAQLTTKLTALAEEPTLAAEQDGALELRFEALMSVFLRSGGPDELLAEVDFERVRLAPRVQGASEERAILGTIGEELEAGGLLARLGPDGSVRGYRFDPALSPEARQWARSLLASFRFVVPRGATQLAEWETLEVDTTGEARCHYRWATDTGDGARRLRKRKLAYVDDPGRAGPIEIAGKAEAEWDAELGWVRSARVEESLAFVLASVEARVSYDFEGELRLVSSEHSAARGATAEELEGPWADPGLEVESEALARRLEFDRRRSALGGAGLEELLAALAGALATSDPDSREVFEALTRLSWLLELEPRSALALEARLRDGSLDEATGALALVALGRAATAEAQAVLARIVDANDLDEGLRAAALQAAFQLPEPGAALLSSVLAASQSGAGTLVGDTALLLLGALARGQALHDPLVAEDLLASLLALEEGALESGSLGVWLDALGNAAAPASVAAIAAYLDAPEPELRASAVEALAGIASSEASAALIEVAFEELELGVRAQAIGALDAGVLDGEAGDAVASALLELAGGDPEPVIRQAALLAIVGGEGLGAAEIELLEHCAQHDASSEVQALASAILEGL